MINREDMLELTRRMTLSRNCFDRIAGSYMDEEGYSDGTFNIHFLKLSSQDINRNLKIAKAIPFSETNVQLKEYAFPGKSETSVQMKQLLHELNKCRLKDDELLYTLYEVAGEQCDMGHEYALFVFHGTYDVPVKASDKEQLGESEIVYNFLIGAFCPMKGEYEPDLPECGFLYPAFSDRCPDRDMIDIFELDPKAPHRGFLHGLMGL